MIETEKLRFKTPTKDEEGADNAAAKGAAAADSTPAKDEAEEKKESPKEEPEEEKKEETAKEETAKEEPTPDKTVDKTETNKSPSIHTFLNHSYAIHISSCPPPSRQVIPFACPRGGHWLCLPHHAR